MMGRARCPRGTWSRDTDVRRPGPARFSSAAALLVGYSLQTNTIPGAAFPFRALVHRTKFAQGISY